MPVEWEEFCEFFVPGTPKSAGSKTAMPIYVKGQLLLKNGRPVVRYVDSCDNKDWIKTVMAVAMVYRARVPLEGPLCVDFTFCMKRPQAHFRANGELKADAPHFHTVKPDLTKIIRCAEDAMTAAGLWRDDCLLADGRRSKVYGPREGMSVVVKRLKVQAEAELFNADVPPAKSP